MPIDRHRQNITITIVIRTIIIAISDAAANNNGNN